MFAGHLGVGLALKRADKRINIGWLFFASLLPDFILGILVLVGVERIMVPADFDNLHYMVFSFPFSHGLVAVAGWTLFIFVLAKLMIFREVEESTKPSFFLAVAIFFHYIADLIVHIPELPILGEKSAKIGFGLWNHMAIAVFFELFLVAGGLFLYLKSTSGKGFSGKYGVVILLVLLSAFTVMGMTVAQKPADTTAPAVAFIIQPFIIAGLGFWLDKKRQ